MLRTSINALLLALALAARAALAAPMLDYTVLQTLQHDVNSFTQGLVYEQGLLYESSGLYTTSFLTVYQAETGNVLTKHALPKEIFAEGLAKVNDELFLLTWRKGILFRLDASTLRVKRTMRYKGEGWGLAKMDQHLVMSNGSHLLSLRDTHTFDELKKIPVRENTQAVDQLNELEYDGQHLWANRWQSTIIYRINPDTGEVSGKVDLAALLPSKQRQPPPDVLNGIAFVPEKNAFWVSGKKWAKRYLIQIKPAAKTPSP